MATVTFPYTLTAGQPENVNNLNSNLGALLTGVNNVESAQIVDGTIVAGDLASSVLDTLSPVGSLVDWAGSGDPTPVSGSIKWLLADGRAVSRTTYSLLFTNLSTTYGVGDGSTTFNLPDLRGRVSAGPDTMGTAQGAASRLASNNTRGAVGGAETFTLGVSNIPQFTPAGTIAAVAGHSHTVNSHTHDYLVTGDGYGGAAFNMVTVGATVINANWQQGKTLYASGTATPGTDTQGGHTPVFTGTPFGQASPTAVNNTQPYQVINKIIRVA
jgi:microcystin-dependent protein